MGREDGSVPGGNPMSDAHKRNPLATLVVGQLKDEFKLHTIAGETMALPPENWENLNHDAPA